MNDPNPVPQQPVLPAEAWYTSPVQRALVAGTITSIVALVIQLFELDIDAQMINAKAGIVVQIANLGFTAWALIKRQTSQVAPLTMTANKADVKNAANPPMLPTDPTKETPK